MFIKFTICETDEQNVAEKNVYNINNYNAFLDSDFILDVLDEEDFEFIFPDESFNEEKTLLENIKKVCKKYDFRYELDSIVIPKGCKFTVDPETDYYTAAYPNARTYSLGINITF